MDVKETSTSEILAELITRDGVDWSEVSQGMEYNYQPPKDGYFIIVPKDAIPHRQTVKERLEEVKAKYAEALLDQYLNGIEEVGAALLALMKGG